MLSQIIDEPLSFVSQKFNLLKKDIEKGVNA